ncbi:thrombospondin type 3 repeat-containing protein [bacterium]|nr:thrombospondin type 3 repeat-containing protein [bacterium]
MADTDSDSDGTPDCDDDCPSDPNKTEPGDCGCGVPETPDCGGSEPGEAVQWRIEDGGNGHWYVRTETMQSWLEGRALAQFMGSDLAACEDPGEWEFLHGLAMQTNSDLAFFGLYQDEKSPLYSEPAGGWIWVSVAEVTNDFWMEGEPNDSRPTGTPSGFGQFRATNGLHSWDDTENVGPLAAWIEWSADCNGDGIVDYGQILDGTFEDTDGNGVPDICDALAAGCDNPGPDSFTQSTSDTLSAGGVACSDSGISLRNDYCRVYAIDDLGGPTFTINCLRFGMINSGSDLSATVNLLVSADGSVDTYADLVLISSHPFELTTANENEIFSVPIDTVVNLSPGSSLVIEVVVPPSSDGLANAAGGTSADVTTGTTYIRASDCGISEYVALGDLGFDREWFVEAKGYRGGPRQWRLSGGGNGHWYQAVSIDDFATAAEMRAAAANRGGNLASISGNAEDAFVLGLALEAASGSALLGGFEIVSGDPNGFIWVDGTPWNYTNWDTTTGQPDDDGAGDYLGYYQIGGPGEQWSDIAFEDGTITHVMFEWSADCNGDGIVDYGQILDGTLADTDGNGIPDICDQPGGADGILDVPSEYATIAEAVSVVPEGGVIQLSLGIYNEVIDFGSKNFVLRGDASDPSSVVLDGTGLEASVVLIEGDQDATSRLVGLTFQGGTGGLHLGSLPDQTVGGGVFVRRATPTVESCIFRENTASFGGGIYLLESDVVMSDCVFTGNIAIADGGGLFAFNSEALIENSGFTTNAAGQRGGGAQFAFGGSILRATFFSMNEASIGGGLYWFGGDSEDSLLVESCQVMGNNALISGGGLSVREDASPLTIRSSVVCGNTADDPETNQFDGDLMDDGSNTICPNVDCDGNGVEDADEIADGTATDTDGDGTIDACDGCPADSNKTEPGTCGCGEVDSDADGDGVPDCVESEIDSGIVWTTEQGGDGHLYAQVVFNTGVTWAEARAFAIGLGGDLASVAFDAEAAVIKPYLLEQDVFRSWIGLYQDASAPDFSEPAGGWRWSDGTPVVYTDWLDGEPSNESSTGQAEDFGMMGGVSNQPPLGWNDKAGRLATALLEWSDDCDGNGIVDRIEVLNGSDCNGNGTLDACDVLSGTSEDVNLNLVPDECEDTLEFDVPGSFATITSAIDAAPDGSVITLGAGTYNEAIDFGTKNLVLQGDTTDPSSVVLDGTDLEVPVVTIVGLQSDAVVRGLTVRGGRAGSPLGGNPDATAGAGIWVRNSTVLIEDCVLDDNACHFGGGIYVKGGSGIIRDTVFTSNEAYNGGGGLYLFDAAIEVVGCIFQLNVAGSEGGASKVSTGTSSFTNCTMTANVADGGGGLSWSPTDSANSLVLTGCSITGNQGLTWAGGIAAQPDLPGVTLFSTILCGNIADDPETNQFYGNLIDDGSNTICPNIDCDENGVEDADEIADGSAMDCDVNGVPDVCDPDADGDGTIDACDGCPEDSNKTEPGTCGCGVEDTDADGDGIADCIDPCPTWPYDCSEDGQTIFVTVDQSIQAAIDVVPDGGTVVLAAGVYNESIDFGSKNLVLEGDASDPSSVVLDGTGLETSVVSIVGDQTSSSMVIGLTISNGSIGSPLPGQPTSRIGGGLFVRDADPLVQDCIFDSNTSGFGGAVYLLNGGAILDRCELIGNSATADGGAIFAFGSVGRLLNCRLDSNTAVNHGGGIKVVLGAFRIMDTVIVGNDGNQGGGLYWFANAGTLPLRVTGCTITGNTAAKAGGGIKSRVGFPAVDLTNTTICGNSPDQVSGIYTDLGGNCISEVCDTDADGTLDCDDNCPEDPNKTEPGDCGCGVEDTDADGDGIPDCNDPCPDWPYDCSEDGQTITVAVDQSIQQAIDVVPDGGTIVLASGTFPLTGPLDPGGRAMTIRGPIGVQGIPTSILDGQDSTRVLICQSGETSETVFENLVIRNGYSDSDGGGMYNVGSSPTLRNCTFVENVADGLGGGMINVGSSSPTLTDCAFTSNAANDGGGLSNDIGSSPELTNCTFASNSAADSGAGGGIFNRDSSNPALLGCTFENNSARYGGGMHNNGASPILVNCIFEGNAAGLWGGGMHSFGSSPVLNNCTFQSNSTADGGRGGGMYNNASSTTLASCSFEGNSAGNGGGGMFNNEASIVSLAECTLCSNTPDQISGDYIDLGGVCISEVCDTDADGTLDCVDGCPEDPDKTEPGDCGCGVADTDSDGDGIADCIDPCPTWPYDCSEDGQTIFVTVDQSIQAAVDVVPDEGTILLAAGTYAEAIDFGSKNLVLEGDVSNPSSVVLDGTGASDTVVKIIGGQTSATVVRGVTIQNGTAGMLLPAQGIRVGGGMMIRNSDPVVEEVVFSANRSQFGGGLYVLGSEGVLNGCSFVSNVADEDGGGLFVQNADVEIANGFFDGNTAANQGGAVKVVIGESVLSNCVMTSNVANEGGGIYWFANADTTPLLVDGCLVTGNNALDSGGGIKTREGGLVPYPGIDLSNTTVCSNEPDDLVGEFNDLGGNTVCPNVDCNLNGIEDATDIADGTSADCNSNGVPDDCETDTDGDGVLDMCETCPDDPNKTEPGACGCGVADTDTDGDGTPDCLDSCPNDPNKIVPGACGCGVADTDTDGDGTPDCFDNCPNDPNKTVPGACGCGVADTDSDGDGTPDCLDNCPADPNKTEPGECGCGVADTDTDGDGTLDCLDSCPNDPNKTEPGDCGCGVADTDTDGDGTPDCLDSCPNDPDKIEPGDCGCGVEDTDTDGDGTPDCLDNCPDDPNKTEPGDCGCGVADTDSDGDGTADCLDLCPDDPNKTEPGDCGCGVADTDTDGDGTADCLDICPYDPNKTEPGDCGCGVADTDTDGDGTADCLDRCPEDPNKTEPGDCGCGVADTDTDGDGTADCLDNCPDDPNKTDPGDCGCGVADTDSDGDGTADCIDPCPNWPYDCSEDGQTITVPVGQSIQDAIDVVPDGGTVLLESGTFLLTTPLDPIGRAITIRGPTNLDGLPMAILDGQGSTRVLICQSGETSKTIFENLMIQNGFGELGGGMYNAASSSPTVINCAFTNNSAVIGGGMYNNSSSPTLVNCTFVSNSATIGGGVYNGASSIPSLANCTLCSNDPDQLIGEYVDLGGNCISDVCDTDADGTRDCDDLCPEDPNKTEPGDCGCGVEDTDSDGDGTADCLDNCPEDPNKTEPGDCGCGVEDTDTDGDGVADCIDPCPAWPYDCSEDGQTITVPLGQSVQAAINVVPAGGTVQLSEGTYSGAIDFLGRAITVQGDPANPAGFVLDGTGMSTSIVKFIAGEGPDSILRGVTLRHGLFGTPTSGGVALAGGGLFISGASPRIEDCQFVSNGSSLGGGAYVEGGETHLVRCTFSLNDATAYGAGLYLANSAATVEFCEFLDNQAGASGGGVHASGGSPMFTACLFEGNLAFQPGGGLSWNSEGQGPCTLDGCQISSNESMTSGGGIATLFISIPPIEILNTSICNNEPDDIHGEYIDLGGNTLCVCIGDLTGDGLVNGADLGILLGSWGPCPSEGSCIGDITGDGQVTGADLGLVLGSWGVCTNP